MRTSYERAVAGGLWLCAGLMMAAGGAVPAWSQTSLEQCAGDSLVLYSPDAGSLSVRLSEPGMRFGAYLSWAELSDEITTCAAVVGAEDLGFSVDLLGSYRDQVDREIEFFIGQAGEVGGNATNRLVVTWLNSYISRSGNLRGEFNVSNNGGVLRLWRGGGAGTWNQLNDGLPQYLRYTDVLALAQSRQATGHLLVHLGSQGLLKPSLGTLGLWEKRSGSPWHRLASSVFPDGVRITSLVFSPESDAVFAVGTGAQGVYVTRDGGSTFRQWTADLAPGVPPPTNFEVTAMTYDDNGRLFVAVRTFGLFVSTDQGQSFSRLASLLVDADPFNGSSTDLVFPFVNEIVVDPSDADRIYAGLSNWAIYFSADAGASWESLGGDWIVPDPESPSAWRHNGLTVAFDPVTDQTVLVGTEKKGIWRTANSGNNWVRVAQEILPDTTAVSPAVRSLRLDPLIGGGVFALIEGVGLAHSDDFGVSWALWSPQPTALAGSHLTSDVSPDNLGGFWLASYGGGIYEPGTPIELSRTILTSSDPELRNLDLGLSISLGSGNVESGDGFRIKCQDFQGYAVWRGTGTAAADMQLIGLYDKTNPETCVEGFCGDENFNITPGCFGEKRAACFDFTDPDKIVFFDDSIYNGFTYNYAITTFDYGNTASVEPPALNRNLIFSPRFLGDGASPFPGPGNLLPFEVNVAAQPDVDGDEIFCYPNPLRRDIGFTGQEGEQVVFRNLPRGSSIQVFTVSGDVVAELPAQGRAQEGGNIYWTTRNEVGTLLAAGIYIWKVDMPARRPFWGKLVIIR